MTRWRGTMSHEESTERFNLFRGHLGLMRDDMRLRGPLIVVGNDYGFGFFVPVHLVGAGHPFKHSNDNTEKNP